MRDGYPLGWQIEHNGPWYCEILGGSRCDVPTTDLAGRTEDAIRPKAQAEGISLSPPNRSPYGDMS